MLDARVKNQRELSSCPLGARFLALMTFSDADNPAQFCDDLSTAIIYQLYVNKDRSASERLLRKVEERGCSAVFLTVDAPVMGKRERDMRAKGDVVETGGGEGGEIKGGGVAAAISGYIDPNLVSLLAFYRRERTVMPTCLD